MLPISHPIFTSLRTGRLRAMIPAQGEFQAVSTVIRFSCRESPGKGASQPAVATSDHFRSNRVADPCRLSFAWPQSGGMWSSQSPIARLADCPARIAHTVKALGPRLPPMGLPARPVISGRESIGRSDKLQRPGKAECTAEPGACRFWPRLSTGQPGKALRPGAARDAGTLHSPVIVRVLADWRWGARQEGCANWR